MYPGNCTRSSQMYPGKRTRGDWSWQPTDGREQLWGCWFRVTPATNEKHDFVSVDDGISEGVSPRKTNRFERNKDPQLARDTASKL